MPFDGFTIRSLCRELDQELNRQATGSKPSCISQEGSKTQIWVIPTDEEIVILNEVRAIIG